MSLSHLVPARTAALFMDFQRDVCAPGGRMVSQDAAVLDRFGAAIGQAARLQCLARNAGLPLLHVRHALDPGYPHHAGMQRWVQAEGAFIEGDAFDRGLRVVVASDACTSGSADTHRVALGILGPVADLATVDELAVALG